MAFTLVLQKLGHTTYTPPEVIHVGDFSECWALITSLDSMPPDVRPPVPGLEQRPIPYTLELQGPHVSLTIINGRKVAKLVPVHREQG